MQNYRLHFSYVQTVVKRKSRMKIQVAIARKILVAVWHMMTKEEDFVDFYLKKLDKEKKHTPELSQTESSPAIQAG